MVGFYGISIIVGYLMPNPIYIYIYIYKLNRESEFSYESFAYGLIREFRCEEGPTRDLIFVIDSTFVLSTLVIVALQQFTVGFIFLLTNCISLDFFN